MMRLSLKRKSWIKGQLGVATKLVHSGVDPCPRTGAILTPIYNTTTFVQDSIEDYLKKGYSYSRTNNPTVAAFEKRVADLEGGAGAACFGTGMAATSCILSMFLKTGDHAIMANCLYGGTTRIVKELFSKYGIDFEFVDMREIKNIENAIKPNTRLIFSETPSNPVLYLCDIEKISSLARSKKIIHVCDSTFATPMISRPLDMGADICLVSLTKFYCGHNITTGGALVANDKDILERIHLGRNMLGSIMNPVPAFYFMQTVKTMGLRVQQASKNANRLAEYLESRRDVSKVVYPGLKSFPQKELADRQHRDNLHGSMLWFELPGGTEAGKKLMNIVKKPWSLCESLGATESIITACAVMTHGNISKEDRDAVGITDGFIRVSCGIETYEDLEKALKEALDEL